jgi:hypothetical protein
MLLLQKPDEMSQKRKSLYEARASCTMLQGLEAQNRTLHTLQIRAAQVTLELTFGTAERLE